MRQKHKRRQAPLATHSLSGISADWPQAVIKICFSSAFKEPGWCLVAGYLSSSLPTVCFLLLWRLTPSFSFHPDASLPTLPARCKNAFI